MSEDITYRRAHIEEAEQIAQLIAHVREQSYDLNPDTMAYAHMVTEMLAAPAVAELTGIIEQTPKKAFATVAVTPHDEFMGVVVGVRSKKSPMDILEHLHVMPDHQGEGIGSNLLRRFQRWAVNDQIAWVLSSNTEGLAFWRAKHFKETASYTEHSIGLDFIKMERQKRRRKAA